MTDAQSPLSQSKPPAGPLSAPRARSWPYRASRAAGYGACTRNEANLRRGQTTLSRLSILGYDGMWRSGPAGKRSRFSGNPSCETKPIPAGPCTLQGRRRVGGRVSRMSLRGASRRSNLNSRHGKWLRFAHNDIPASSGKRLCVRRGAVCGGTFREFGPAGRMELGRPGRFVFQPGARLCRNGWWVSDGSLGSSVFR